MPERIAAIEQWLAKKLPDLGFSENFQLIPVSNDASFRRYFRLGGGSNLIVMDAPPAKENTQAFITVAKMLTGIGINAPRIDAIEAEQGFLLLSDLGTQAYLDVLDDHNVDILYQDALNALMLMQTKISPEQTDLPAYNVALLLSEMELFREWYLQRHVGFSLSQQHEKCLDDVFGLLARSALDQPQVFVHRDYHSRNLMFVDDNNPGVIDFQDAVIGPITYDLVSLLRDCYITWPRQRVEDWALNYLHLAVKNNIATHQQDTTFLRWFDLMGVQRHLKAIGIFSRLHLRDNKPAYLDDIPRTLAYVKDVSARYPDLECLHSLLTEIEK